MSDSNIARRYARALVELATEAGNADAVERDLANVVDTLLAHDGELFKALSNPVFTAEERGKVLNVVLPRLGASDLSRRFLMLVSERGRLGSIVEIRDIYTSTMDERAGRVRVRVSTVDPLSPQLEGELKAAFATATGKTIVLDARIDPSLIGGMVARIGGRVYDASIRSRLEDIKHRLINAQAAPEA
jgi:F-type H+-transporting ATPase subunit delta